ncbi:hypothetical protein [Streptomyces sp. Root264]|uniref:VMAP-C domain-containing protein n=1 Tax=Streptomyces sp. Root264 TaxID=1736503 RepID=UPI000ADA48A5|nr:hypothetical protein [Streptomyces sp. Root264]
MSPSTQRPLASHPDPLAEEAVRLLAEIAESAGSRSKLWLGTVEHFLGQSIPALDARDGTRLAGRVIDTCVRKPFGLVALADALPRLGASPDQTERMRSVADEWQARQFYPDADWPLMRARLTQLPPQRLHVLCRAATEGRLTALPERCQTPWDALIYLTGINATPTGLPPALLFLVRLAEELDQPETGSPAADDCLRWARAWAHDWELQEELDQAQAFTDTNQAPSLTGGVIIQLGPDVLERDVYVLSYWIQSDVRAWSPRRGRDRTVTSREVQDAVCQVVELAEKELRLDHPLMVECVVPFELLNLPVEQFTVQNGSSVPLGGRHTVFVRSLERLRNRSWHREWHSRWAHLNSHTSHSKIRFLPEDEQPGEAPMLDDVLGRDRQLAVLCLDAPPQRAEMDTALRRGVPVVIWPRQAAANLRSTVEQLANENDLADLPLRLSEARRHALNAGDREPHGAAMRGLAVMWDDPQRQPEATEDVGPLWVAP